MTGRRLPRPRRLRTRLLVFIVLTLAVVCGAMALTTVLAGRDFLLGSLDERVTDAAERAQGGLQRRMDDGGKARDLSFLDERGQTVGTLGARLSGDSTVLAAAVVPEDGELVALDAGQLAALDGIEADGRTHTRSIPGLGTYRLRALAGDGEPVLAGLPVGEVEHLVGRLITVGTAVYATGLLVAGCTCAVVIARQLRPLGRVAATAADVAGAPLGHGEVGPLTRVPAPDTDPVSEAGQVGAALNRLIDHVEASLAERRRHGERIRLSEDRMRRFLADAGHELRTPLASIVGYAELMNRPVPPVDPALAWRRVDAESARMAGLVEDLLLLARLDEGQLGDGRPPAEGPTEGEDVDLAGLVAEAVWDARAAGGGHHWQVALESADGALTVRGDRPRLHQIVANLLTNARVHTPPGTSVLASVTTDGAGHVLVRVRDDGPGIDASLLPTVFERFTRADTSRSRATGSTGLGLAIAAALAHAHDGHSRWKVSRAARSSPCGCRFQVRLR